MMQKIFSILSIVSILLISCNNSEKQNTETKPELEKKEAVAVYKTVEVDIEGMTCEIGCARTIESKLSKIKGISYSKVDFESKKGLFTYDSNLLNEQDIAAKIEGIAGGDLYFVKEIKEVEKNIK